MAGLVMWDFDGTLATRPGLWSGCVIEVLDEHEPGHSASVELVRAGMRGRYPWNRHEQAHEHLREPAAWWAELEGHIAGAIAGCGIAPMRARELAIEVRERFVNPRRGWVAYADSVAALQLTRANGWSNVILSNHIPELARIVEHLGLGGLVEEVHSSALSGYEKPHPEAFRLALAAGGNPSRLWMIGDNPLADVAGARALGIPAILVRSAGEAELHAEDALAAAQLVLTQT